MSDAHPGEKKDSLYVIQSKIRNSDWVLTATAPTATAPPWRIAPRPQHG